ncbi:hypothetical protein [Streptomyces sp. NPDC020917]|uniref:hypothetical protein n=1 Tax=Streptomyces sp. NPDC020917 TaxID=3365102 RepID=UPI00378DC43B
MSPRAFLRVPARGGVVLTAAALAVACGFAGAGTAQAQPLTATFNLTGDAGDTITGGNAYAYDAGTGATFAERVTSSANTNNSLYVSVKGTTGEQWVLYLQAPSGQPLTPGQYDGATKYQVGSAPAQPALYLSSSTKTCTTVAGSFTITDIAFAPNDGVQQLDATFEQHCNGAAAASRGEVHLTNPAPLALNTAITATGTFSSLNGNATVQGTLSCNTAARLSVSGTVTQVAHRTIIRGSIPAATVDCTPGTPVPWSGTAVPTGTTPFQHGDVEVTLTATTNDPTYGSIVATTTTGAVTLKKG